MTQRVVQIIIQAIAVIGLLVFLAYQFVVFVVDQRELAVVLRFGKPVRSITEPGLYFKTPFIENVRMLPSTLQFWGDSESEVLQDLPTRDNKKIELKPWAVWKVNDPIAFVQRLRTMENAEQRVAQFVRGAMRDVITQYDLSDLVRSTNREMKMAELEFESTDLEELADALPEGVDLATNKEEVNKEEIVGRQTILDKINADARRRLATNVGDENDGARGIELVDVGISSIDFVETVRRTTFDRWIAERDAISTRNVQQGEQAKQEILNKTNAEIEKIKGQGQQKASQIRGEADAQIIKRYAEAIQQVGEFYSFVRTLEAYEASIDSDTQLILTTDNEFLNSLQQLGPPPEMLEPADKPE